MRLAELVQAREQPADFHQLRDRGLCGLQLFAGGHE